VFQGEREIAKANKALGNFELTGIAPAPRGVPQIEVTFDIDANGIVHVSAKDRGTNKEQSMTISGGSALPKEDIERMVREAEEHAAEDAKRREEAEARNTGEALVYSTEKFLEENGDKVPADEKSATESALAELKEALKPESSASPEDINAKATALSEASQKMGAAMYAAQAENGDAAGAAGAEGAAGEQKQGGDDVVDAEVVEDDDDTSK